MQRLILMGILMFGTVACSDSLATTISPTTISPTEKDPEIILTQVNFGQKSLLETQYFDIEFDEFQIGTNVRGMGGALIGDGTTDSSDRRWNFSGYRSWKSKSAR